MSSAIYLGIDLGTSGVRGSAIDRHGNELASASIGLPQVQQPDDWQQAAFNVIGQLCDQVDPGLIEAIAVDGTSGTVLLCDEHGTPCSAALMYNDQSCTHQAEIIARCAPEDSAAHGASSSLAKALYLLQQTPGARHVCHQADWISGLLCGRFDISDENNCLKLGYDPLQRTWPSWLAALGIDIAKLPQVYVPGTVVAPLERTLAQQLGLPADCRLVAGTTDSIAAFIATGDTSLGSTLVLKLVSDRPVYSSRAGVYSHRLGDTWLAGGASNSGGKVLLKYFDQARINQMTEELEAESPTGLDYYPLVEPGERFPRSDPQLQPVLAPRPDNDVQFFQAMLEGMAAIENEGYRALTDLGAPSVKRVFTAGGGSCNPAWRKIRERTLGVPVTTAVHSEASYGSALLAMRACC